MAVYDPYKGVNWSQKQRVMSFSHGHCESQAHFDRYVQAGFQHFPVSNYHPSQPLGAATFQEYMQGSGSSGLLYCPNSELGYSSIGHSGTFSWYVHFCSLGSEYVSGTDEEEERDRWTWKTQFRKILNGLIYADGGGITLNHPAWTLNNQTGYEPFDEEKELNWFVGMLDFDPRVLGVEIINGGGYRYEFGSHSVEFWDKILATGRKCFCFCTPDWDVATYRKENGKGRNILLVDSVTEHDCLKAYRNGHFYGKSGTTNLSISEATYDEGLRQYHVNMPNAEQIAIVIDGVYTTYNNDEVTVTVPIGAKYIRSEGYKTDASDEEIGRDEVYTQAVMLRQRIFKNDDSLLMK